MHVLTRFLRIALEPVAVRAYYERVPVQRLGWRGIALSPPASAWVAAYESTDGRHALAVVALKPQGVAGDRVPLAIVTDLVDPPRRP